MISAMSSLTGVVDTQSGALDPNLLEVVLEQGGETQESPLTPQIITAEIERTRMSRILYLDAEIARRKAEREDLAGQMRFQMNRDGVVRHKIPGVGTATLREFSPPECKECAAKIRKRDPYLSVKPEAAA